MNQALQYYSLVLNILCVTYFLTSITISDSQTSDMRQIRKKWFQRLAASSGISSS